MTQILDFLKTRRSTPMKILGGDGPSPKQIQDILTIASRVPDHNKLAPWWFVVFEGDNRAAFGKILRDAYLSVDPDAPEEKLAQEEQKFLRAPVIIAVISRIKCGKAPQWEQMLSCGAACYNLILAANAMGFGANWLTEWPAFNDKIRDVLGCDARDNIAGFIYIGTQSEKPDDRDRPALSDISVRWEAKGYTPNKGEMYEKPEFALPKSGIKPI